MVTNLLFRDMWWSFHIPAIQTTQNHNSCVLESCSFSLFALSYSCVFFHFSVLHSFIPNGPWPHSTYLCCSCTCSAVHPYTCAWGVPRGLTCHAFSVLMMHLSDSIYSPSILCQFVEHIDDALKYPYLLKLFTKQKRQKKKSEISV
jgi:hypothetical protein